MEVGFVDQFLADNFPSSVVSVLDGDTLKGLSLNHLDYDHLFTISHPLI